MLRRFERFVCAVTAGGALGLASPAYAQLASPGGDSAAKSAQAAPSADETLPAYHHSIFSWDHTVTAQTLGVGDTPRSYNPTYTMGFVARTRYYLVDDTPKGEHLSLRLDAGLYREFTNSDVTTQRGEWDLSDTELAAAYVRRFRGPSNTNGTMAEVRPLTLTLPTSKISWDSGRYFAPGVVLGLTHVTPVFPGKLEQVSASVRFAVGYKRWFARATVPTNESLERVRLGPDGRSLPSDALSGSSLVRDQLDFTARVRFELGSRLLWTTDAGFAPAWKYDVQPDVMLCNVVLTGCADVTVSDNDSRYLVRTQFASEVSLLIGRGLSVELGYGNSANQLGRDGRRRSFFYSPEAVFYTSLSFMPHELVQSSKRIANRPSASPLL